MASKVALVYGSITGSSRSVDVISKGFPDINGLELVTPIEGNAFDVNVLADCKLLVVCASRGYALPQLLLLAEDKPGCLSHLQHAVYEQGDAFGSQHGLLDMPRYIDELLEKCGSRRFFPRGETGKPFAPLDCVKLTVQEWTSAMWAAAAKADPGAPSVPLDITWEGAELKSKL
mmetsp:Transcript_28218/g.49290  ORF Transcript_28218/g.49290 Transcript_28218/m.49290 type:complete len:174 (-) Transcript_28218:544-1065(-)